jgi:outer membrane protein, protease secretion system
LEQTVASSRVSVEATIKSMTAGVRTNFGVINARERLTAAERELLSASCTHLLAFLRLRFHAGALAETHLMQVAGIEARKP